ncbi:MAG: metallophosphatase family protein [Bacteroidales bacterium]|nr:metallophosphatase family protein [Bacteroidales bacterium]
MALIGILSDTHCYIGDFVFQYFNDCDEIWHAGDIGNIDTYDTLKNFKTLRAVFGNIDGFPLTKILPVTNIFEFSNLKVMIKHIVGYPGKYDKSVKSLLTQQKFDIVIGGHSHILRIMYDKNYHFLYINPGAAGLYGIHHKITLVKLEIINGKIKDAYIWEKPK